MFLLALGTQACRNSGGTGPCDRKTPPPATFAASADDAMASLVQCFYDDGQWKLCAPDQCGSSDVDWGADSLTYDLYFRFHLTNDTSVVPLMSALNAAGPTGSFYPGSNSWSDVPEWDSVAAAREFAVTNDATALDRAKAAFAFVDTATQFALGACPTIDYQLPNGGGNKLKTLETDSNYVKAALLLYSATGDGTYLDKAVAKYGAVRQYFLDPAVPLYTVYVFDDGTGCRQASHRFFASVNGNMISNGLALASATGDPRYRDEALASAQAVSGSLGDASGVYADLQAENDVVEPLIEAMYDVATLESQPFARAWLLANAQAAASDRKSDGTYGRFFGGPAPQAPVTAWQTNGGFALAFAAQALEPGGSLDPSYWAYATYVPEGVTTLPFSLTFTGRAIAVIGTIGEHCCESGHARVFLDGSETFDGTGIWQNKTAAGTLPNSVLFAWRWPDTGTHTIDFQPGIFNAKEGDSFLDIAGYWSVP